MGAKIWKRGRRKTRHVSLSRRRIVRFRYQRPKPLSRRRIHRNQRLVRPPEPSTEERIAAQIKEAVFLVEVEKAGSLWPVATCSESGRRPSDNRLGSVAPYPNGRRIQSQDFIFGLQIPQAISRWLLRTFILTPYYDDGRQAG